MDVWDDMVGLPDVDSCVECLSIVMRELIDMFCPMKWVRVRQNSPCWCVTPEIRQLH